MFSFFRVPADSSRRLIGGKQNFLVTTLCKATSSFTERFSCSYNSKVMLIKHYDKILFNRIALNLMNKIWRRDTKLQEGAVDPGKFIVETLTIERGKKKCVRRQKLGNMIGFKIMIKTFQQRTIRFLSCVFFFPCSIFL